MITFKETNQRTGVKEIVHICTFCSQEHKFYYISPERCDVCDKVFPNIAKLHDDSSYRVKYHFFKDTINDT
jgi:hypothetical protein